MLQLYPSPVSIKCLLFVFCTERPDFEGGLILRRGCTVEHVVCNTFADIFCKVVCCVDVTGVQPQLGL